MLIRSVLLSLLWVITPGCKQNPTAGQMDDVQLLTLKSKCRDDGEKVRQEWKRTYFQDTFSEEPVQSKIPDAENSWFICNKHQPEVRMPIRKAVLSANLGGAGRK
jgi:hypothetical protein